MKKYDVDFSIAIREKASAYEMVPVMRVKFEGLLPENVTAESWLRNKVGRALKEAWSEQNPRIENFEDEKAKADPLNDDLPL